MSSLRAWLAALVFVAGLAGPSVAQDIEGATDHPLIPRYEGSEIQGSVPSAFDEYELITGAMKPEEGYTVSGDTAN